MKQMRQVLNVGLKQRDRYVQRLQSVTKDTQNDVSPMKVFDFIKQEKSIQKESKSLV